jgi:hypothetical protein
MLLGEEESNGGTSQCKSFWRLSKPAKVWRIEEKVRNSDKRQKKATHRNRKEVNDRTNLTFESNVPEAAPILQDIEMEI